MRSVRSIYTKRIIEEIIMFPFIIIGKLIAICKPLKEEYDFFFFLPTYCIGGAEKINGNIIAALPDKKIIIFFTRDPKDGKLRHLFELPNVTIKEIDKWTDNKFIYWANLIYRGICAHYINRQKKVPVVFNGQCNFAYKLFPHLNKAVMTTELIHNSNLQFAKVTFPYVPFIDKRVMYTDSIIAKHVEYYHEIGFPREYDTRISKIINTVDIPEYREKEKGKNLKVYYAGRGGYQKRLELLFEIIRRSLQQELPIDFFLAGTFEDEIPADVKPKVTWLGSIATDEEMYKLHHKMDVLLMTSRFEGFPVAIMEAMSCGVTIVSTAVDGIPEHIKMGRNGFLMEEINNDKKIVDEGLYFLKQLSEDRALLEQLSRNNYNYAKEHFNENVFRAAYRRFFEL